ncbi:hypothetical protein SAMN05216567_12922 [Variovorax sp. OK605]|uniref:DUF6348 family protein n=1 Tax=Variovorax sp. OK605 TaxID=1855317 RepID=UPI0008E0161C|nr:DUF6348 family protein [Variovorax sp. OK605]SFQ71515.1 hypothetical protein SAMN05216567_12922 [Variovorax sp. OK605]
MTFPSSDYFPSRLAGNPGQGASFEMSYRNDERSWSETVDLSAMLLETLAARGHEGRLEREGWVVLSDGLWLLPQILSLSVESGDKATSSTTIEVAHEQLLPGGTFEFQHSAGGNATDTLASGFDLWAQVDLVVYQDALRKELGHCTSMEMNWQEGRARRVLFGPVAHRMAHPEIEANEEHPFCPCCLFTNTWDAFRPQIESDAVYGVRLYAARDSQGQVQADCRVNGEDWPAGADALRAYVTQWPDRGFEFRKQYVVIQSPPQAVVAE